MQHMRLPRRFRRVNAELFLALKLYIRGYLFLILKKRYVIEFCLPTSGRESNDTKNTNSHAKRTCRGEV